MRRSLIDILKNYNTDKDLGRISKDLGHLYGASYEEIFNTFNYLDYLNILEVGVQKGGSILAWKDYFPNATVYGVDIEDQRVPEYRQDRVNFILSDIKKLTPQSSPSLFSRKFDILIDDGKHCLSDIFPFISNFLPYMTEKGFFIIEDCQQPELWLRDISSSLDLNKFNISVRDTRNIVDRYDDYLIIITHKTNEFK